MFYSEVYTSVRAELNLMQELLLSLHLTLDLNRGATSISDKTSLGSWKIVMHVPLLLLKVT